MKRPPVKGTRDFYPPDMARRNWIIDGWKKVSLRNGFEEYDGPIFEYLKMFQLKSGDEIAEQLFSLTDRGGRELALRPEITPTMARMINQQINALPKPIKWFSVPRLFRAERPQKGRLREFFQWNVDIIGVDDVLADAEIIFTTIDYLSSVGLTPRDIRVKISSRKLLACALTNIGIREKQLDPLYGLLDKYNKIPADTFEKMLPDQVPDSAAAKKIMDLMSATTLSEVPEIAGTNAEVDAAIQKLARLKDLLEQMGVWQFCDFYPSIVRGLAYYTGVVFEVYEFAQELRAIGGGGRYDNLLQDFGGPSVAATGMGMGDCVLGILLEEKGLLEKQLQKCQLDYFIACADKQYFQKVIEITAKLRRTGKAANFAYKPIGLSKQLKQASAQGAKECIIIGSEIESGRLVVKDMATGEQKTTELDNLLK
ncbi:MAG: histidine--tRNA ligase [Planctomycetota bacterium]|nr:MAG: histidine--tRNA ligase [Planctomycetota bacterium]